MWTAEKWRREEEPCWTLRAEILVELQMWAEPTNQLFTLEKQPLAVMSLKTKPAGAVTVFTHVKGISNTLQMESAFHIWDTSLHIWDLAQNM